MLRTSMVDPFFEDPIYLREVLVHFIMTNLLLCMLGSRIAVWCWLGGSKSRRPQ